MLLTMRLPTFRRHFHAIFAAIVTELLIITLSMPMIILPPLRAATLFDMAPFVTPFAAATPRFRFRCLKVALMLYASLDVLHIRR